MKAQLIVMALHGNIWECIEFVMSPLLEAYRGRARQLQLYRHLGYASFDKDCIDAGLPNYGALWQKISNQRNQFAHTTVKPESSISPREIRSFIHETLIVFSLIHNKYNRETTGYDAATCRTNYSEEIKKLLENDEEDA
ncbi:MAG: hypothetical protein JWR19_981 [Pedosphaera sp.]|nr:hypothetical protein [Pedosphaera sp.]